MFDISSVSVDCFFQSQKIDPRVGAVVVFEGRVRNYNNDRKVTSLEYQCYKEMAIKEGQKIVQQAMADFSIIKACCVHREGLLQIGDVAVMICVYSAHREAAFDACRYIIDKVKLRVPIWKKEHYQDKTCEWVACHGCANVDR